MMIRVVFLPVDGNAGDELEAPGVQSRSLWRASISAFVELRAVRGVIIRIKKQPPLPARGARRSRESSSAASGCKTLASHPKALATLLGRS